MKGTVPDRAACWWLTGYQGAGKTTLAHALARELESLGRRAEVVDGDAFRASQESPLGYSREARNLNVRRIADYVSGRMDRRVDAIVAAMSPFRESRAYARRTVSSAGLFVEVHVATPLLVCQRRDTKGLYAAFERGDVGDLPGLDLPYEPPPHAEATVQMIDEEPQMVAKHVIAVALGQAPSRDPMR